MEILAGVKRHLIGKSNRRGRKNPAAPQPEEEF